MSSSSPFGSATPAQPTGGFSFGSATPAKPTGGFSFASPTPAKPTGGFSFGSATPAKPTGGFSFGSATPAQPTGGFLFASPTPAKPTSSSSFGSPTPAKPTTSSPATALEALSKCIAQSSKKCKIKAPTFTFPAVNQNGELKDTDSQEVFGRSIQIVPDIPPLWRNVQWTEERRTSLMETVSSYTPSSEEVTQARVLLLGPVGSGKSSFISSVHSVFNGRVTIRAMVGSSSTCFTKKSFTICGQKEKFRPDWFCVSYGSGDGEMTGLTLHDILSVIKGHVPEGHKFCPDQAVRSETGNYVKWPSLKDKIHCVAFVLDASKIATYSKGLRASFQQLREHISDLGIHQVALLTHVDEICPNTAKDVSMVYKSQVIKETMSKAADLMGMATSYIVPVKNYSSELDLNVNTDVLLLSAVEHILQYVDLYFQENTPQETESEEDSFKL
ncbi:interferon-induced protein 44-like isoform X2 [Hippoglossus stenolepis]|uniref:interferon-induced protein 44-like isoform X2 n=1 Tax=Hippoglossus stenolepis TaxID=195615 RepID=UPI001FB02501|nr:interferon-induced protein 44-like isoform X2 [Hippoglossus stenolepis]